MIFVKNSHFVWDPSRQRKLRKKLGHLIKSNKDTLDDMLEEHLEQVQSLLLEQKSEFDEETDDMSSRTDEGPQTVEARTSRIRSVSHTSRLSDASDILRSPRLPQIGLFTVSSPRSPRSPMKRTF